MSAPVLIFHHPDCRDHHAGPANPETADRLDAVVRGIHAADLGEAITLVEQRPATLDELARVHDPNYAPALRQFCERGGGRLDQDTAASEGSFSAAVLAAGAALDAVEHIERGEGHNAFCAVRPPGHHATARRPQGFCIFNNVAVCAAALAERGEWVLILDWDAHHGNGTQEMFYADARVLYVSLHQWPLYPGTGRLEDTGEGEGRGYTINLPLPAGATGDVYRST
jgi:acetoin utilization deacetylase AcuC-like enzyme